MLQLVKHCANLGFVVASSTDSSTDATCPVCATADVICGKWTILVIRDLADGHSRFCELERSLAGISPRTLSLRLRALEDEGVVERHTFAEVPPRVEYSLTRKGEALLPLIEDMRSYGREWLGGQCGENAGRASEPVGAVA
jgi:DNA-binding HxlR family transcriptional regulator